VIWPAGQVHVAPGPGQVWPMTEHCAFVQQRLFAMQLLLPGQKNVPGGQVQVPPGPVQMDPGVPEQSATLQQLLLGMQLLLDGQTLKAG
jgi:hypothetical protein